MYALYSLTEESLPLIHTFHEHTDPQYTLHYTVMFLLGDEPIAKTYINVDWNDLRYILLELIHYSDNNNIHVLVTSAVYAGGYVGQYELPFDTDL